jgi:hypothetical protein
MVPYGLTGVVHLRAVPGDPGYDGLGIDAVVEHALRDARAWREGGVSQVIVENFGSAPFSKGSASDPAPLPQVLAVARVADRVRDLGLTVGINLLRNDGSAALAVAATTGARFVRVNVLSGAVLTDQGWIEGEAARLLRFRAALGADCAILADLRVKHAAPLVERSLHDEIEELQRRAGADAVLVTGRGTGHPPDPGYLAEVLSIAQTTPVFLASGLTVEGAPSFAPYCHGAIVGTAAKEGGDVRRPVDPNRVRALVRAVEGRFLPAPSP